MECLRRLRKLCHSKGPQRSSDGAALQHRRQVRALLEISDKARVFFPQTSAPFDVRFFSSCFNHFIIRCISPVPFSLLFSASTDKTVGVWDSETGERIKRLKGHTSFVNTCYPARRGPQLICTGSDDGTVKVKFCLHSLIKLCRY